jgi:hypothetical protein
MLLTLANYADDTGCCWPSQETLARDTEQSLDSVQRYLRKLEKLELIRKVARPMGPGRWSSRTYFLPIPVAKMSKPQSAAQSDDAPERNETPQRDAFTIPQGARDHAANRPVTMPHQARHHAAPVRHEPSLEPSKEPSLEPLATLSRISSGVEEVFKPTLGRPTAAERQRAFSEERKGIEVLQHRIAQKIGGDGWEILGLLSSAELQRVTDLEERGRLDAAAIEFLRLKKPRGASMKKDLTITSRTLFVSHKPPLPG